jgi:hypothetical protein
MVLVLGYLGLFVWIVGASVTMWRWSGDPIAVPSVAPAS